MASQGFEQRQNASRRIVPVKENGPVVGQVEVAADDLHALAVHGPIVIARGHGCLKLLLLDSRPGLQELSNDGLPVPARVRTQEESCQIGAVCAVSRPAAYKVRGWRWRRRGQLALRSAHGAHGRCLNGSTTASSAPAAAWPELFSGAREAFILKFRNTCFVRTHLCLQQGVCIPKAGHLSGF